jgi:hypothetical protein
VYEYLLGSEVGYCAMLIQESERRVGVRGAENRGMTSDFGQKAEAKSVSSR